MPAKSKTTPKTQDQENQPEGVLVGAAKAIGGLAGKVAAAVGATGASEAPQESRPRAAEPKKGKLPKKNKSRLPRRQKKEMKKKAAARAV